MGSLSSTGILLLLIGGCMIFVAGIAIGEANAERQVSKHVEAWSLIEQLRAPEGATVTICCDNPDFGGPGSVVEVCDDWTDWLPRRFEGDTVLDALRAARYTKGER